MITRMLEVRDDGTHIPVMVHRIRVDAMDRQWVRAGYAVGQIYTILINLNTLEGQSDWSKWSNGRTLQEAHRWIEKHFDELMERSVVDVEWILGERETIKEPEA